MINIISHNYCRDRMISVFYKNNDIYDNHNMIHYLDIKRLNISSPEYDVVLNKIKKNYLFVNIILE